MPHIHHKYYFIVHYIQFDRHQSLTVPIDAAWISHIKTIDDLFEICGGFLSAERDLIRGEVQSMALMHDMIETSEMQLFTK